MARTKRKVNPLLPVVKSDVPIQTVYRTGGYVRLSMEDSGKPGADTFENQQNLILSYIEKQADMELCKIYCDNGRTGANFERPAFEELLADVKTGKINCIVVKDLSRFGRNYKETGNFLERVFPFLNVRFIAITDYFDTLTAERNEYGFVVPLKNLMNETYSRDISKKVSSAIATKEKQGKFMGTWAPYGYSKSVDNKHKLVINDDTAPVVREIFSMRLEGIGYEIIAKTLNERKVPAPAAYLFQTGLTKAERYEKSLWRAWNIKEILNRKVYLGHLEQGKRTQQSYKQARTERFAPEDEWRVVYNTHEAIIDEGSFRVAQDLATERKAAYQERIYKNGSVKTPNLFRGLVYCGDCGKALSRTHLSCKRQGGKHFYYSFICITPRSMPTACTRKNLSEVDLLEVVWQQIQCHLQAVTKLEQSIQDMHNAKSTSVQNLLAVEISATEKELNRYKGLHDSLYQSLVDGVVTKQEYVLMREGYQTRCDESKLQLSSLQEKKREMERCSLENPMFTALHTFKIADTLTEELIHTLISRIEYGDDNEIKINFTYQNELSSLTQYAQGGAVV